MSPSRLQHGVRRDGRGIGTVPELLEHDWLAFHDCLCGRSAKFGGVLDELDDSFFPLEVTGVGH